jgi:uncharacterized protein YneF (UPF0154 family)
MNGWLLGLLVVAAVVLGVLAGTWIFVALT